MQVTITYLFRQRLAEGWAIPSPRTLPSCSSQAGEEEEAGLSSSGDSRPYKVPGRTCYLLLRAPGPIRAPLVPETQMRRSMVRSNLQCSVGGQPTTCLPTSPVSRDRLLEGTKRKGRLSRIWTWTGTDRLGSGLHDART